MNKTNNKQSVTRRNNKTLEPPKISQTERKNRKMIEQILAQDQKKNQNIENHHDLEVNHVKITKHSSHNLKYLRKLNFKTTLNSKLKINIFSNHFELSHFQDNILKHTR